MSILVFSGSLALAARQRVKHFGLLFSCSIHCLLAVSGSLARSNARLYVLGPDQISMQDFFHNLRMDRPSADMVSKMMQDDTFDDVYTLPEPESLTSSTQKDSVMWCMSQGPFHFRHTEDVRDNSLITTHPTYTLTQLQQVKGFFTSSAKSRIFQAHTF